MNNNKKFFSLLTLTTLFVVSCGDNISISNIVSPSVSTSPSTSTSTSTSPSVSVVPLTPDEKFDLAINNTKYYSLQNAKQTKYYEIKQRDFYYYSPAFQGYIIPDNDPNYFHSFSVKNVQDNGEYYDILELYGRTFRKNELNNYTSFTMHAIIDYIRDYFKHLDGDTYYCDTKEVSSLFEEFFQQKLMGSTNYFEIDIKDNRLYKIRFYEVYQNSDPVLNEECIFSENNGKDAKFYTKWVEQGCKETIRIRDIKYFIPSQWNPNVPVSPYENESVTINAVISAKKDDTIYVTQNDERSGPIGLMVLPKESANDINIGDHVVVSGTIKTNSQTKLETYMFDATFTKTGEVSSIPPSYDEDYMVDKYGGGTYAAMMFSRNVIYSSSLYSTYAYLYETPVKGDANNDTVVTLICPNVSDLNGEKFLFELVIPKELDETQKNSLFETINNAGVYSSTLVSTAIELSFENFLVDYTYDTSIDEKEYRGNYYVSIVATSNSTISNRKTLVEKVEAYFNLSDFPVFSNTNVSYKFGGASELYIEETYGDFTNKSKTGLVMIYENAAKLMFTNYLTTLTNYGFTKFDEVKDQSRTRHYIYTLDNVVLDLCLESDGTLLCWMYNAPIVMKKSIEEVLKDAVGDFVDVDTEFTRLSGTYDADYTVYNLLSYGGIDFSDDPLTVVAIDLKTDRRSDLITEFVQKLGYGQYRYSEGERPATYYIRGHAHNGLYSKKEGKELFIDVASYPTSDYTYGGHDEFEWRIELVFTKSKTPLNIPTHNTLEPFQKLLRNAYEGSTFDVTLPSDAKVELWLEEPNNIIDRDITYGFGSSNQAFVYTSDVDTLYDDLKVALLNAGYTSWGGTNNVFQVVDDNNYSHHICLLKLATSVRIIQGLGGFDFWQQ